MADLELTVDALGLASPCALTAQLVVPPEHPVLAGHFPGAPVVPGVLLLDAVRLAWQRACGCRVVLAGVDDARWFAPVAPGTAVLLRARVEVGARGEVVVDGEWHAAERRVAAFTLRLAEPRG